VKAIALFQESLKIQRSVLVDENKLVQSSLDSLGYAYAMLGKYDKVLKVNEQVWNAVKNSQDFPDEKAIIVRKYAICHCRLEQWGGRLTISGDAEFSHPRRRRCNTCLDCCVCYYI